MVNKTSEQMITELYISVVGLPENPLDNGLIGDISEINSTIKNINSTVQSNVNRLVSLETEVNVIKAEMKNLTNSVRPIRVTPKQAMIGGSFFTFLVLILTVFGEVTGWW